MEEYIRNIAAIRSADGNIMLSWVWPSGYSCVRVVFLHRLGGKDIKTLSPAELGAASDLCFMDEFQIAGGKYVYPIGANDAGLLKFRVYCCDSPEQTDFDKCSAPVSITGITINVRYKTSAKKSGKTYRKFSFTVTADANIPTGSLAYRIRPSGALYTINTVLPSGTTEVGPVILGIQEDAVLELAPGHEEEFAITAG